jgi:4,5-dihydroxyphthalate decarboxylase
MHIAVLRFDRTAALIDGTVALPDVNVISTPGGKASVQGFLSGAFDAADVPFARYVYWKFQGMPVTAVPVFTDRLFQHAYIYTRTDTGITSLADLRGRRVICAPSYFSTPSFWHRALLQEEGGVAPQDVEWVAAGAEADGMKVPNDIRIEVAPASWLGLERLLDGTGDCLMTARTAMVPRDQRHRVKRVLADADQRQRDWARRHGFFPALHVFAVHDSAIAARPSFGEELCDAFDRSKDRAYRVLQDERMTGLPFMRGYLDDTVATLGDDPWPYGVTRNRAEIDHFLGLAQAQGLTSRRLAAEELFDARAAQFSFAARMTPGCITGVMEGGWAPQPTWPD